MRTFVRACMHGSTYIAHRHVHAYMLIYLHTYVRDKCICQSMHACTYIKTPPVRKTWMCVCVCVCAQPWSVSSGLRPYFAKKAKHASLFSPPNWPRPSAQQKGKTFPSWEALSVSEPHNCLYVSDKSAPRINVIAGQSRTLSGNPPTPAERMSSVAVV